jgi:hypothetical protein
MFGRDGRTVFIEFKAPGAKPTRQQILRHIELVENFGFEVYWVNRLDDARELLNLGEE